MSKYKIKVEDLLKLEERLYKRESLGKHHLIESVIEISIMYFVYLHLRPVFIWVAGLSVLYVLLRLFVGSNLNKSDEKLIDIITKSEVY